MTLKLKFQGVLEGWTVNQLTRKWRPWQWEAQYEMEDMLQEAYLLFMELQQTYKDKIENEKHFTSLYKTSFYRMMCDLTNDVAVHAKREEKCDIAVPDENGTTIDQIGDMENLGFMHEKLRGADPEIRKAMALIADGRLTESLLSGTSQHGYGKDSGNRMICMALGLDQDRDIVNEVYSYLT